MMTDAFFTTTDGSWFTPTSHSRGPWSADNCHAGPPTGLIARAMQRAVPAKRLTRVTVELTKPIPFAGFRVEADVGHEGKTVTTSSAMITDGDGVVRVRAFGLHLRASAPQDLPTTTETFGSPTEAATNDFPIRETLHGLPAFNGDGVEVKYPPGHGPEPGPTVAWMRTVPLLADEEPSPFERICPLADCGNAFGRNAEPWEVSFVNPDLTVVLHRDPVGEWLGTSAVSRWEHDGIGMADALLFDELGPVGRAVQTLLVRRAEN